MIIELVMLQQRPGVSQEQFLTAAAAATAFLREQEGFVRRVISRKGQEEWVDMVYWADKDSAERAGALFASAPEAATFMSVLVLEKIQLFHLQIVAEQQ